MTEVFKPAFTESLRLAFERPLADDRIHGVKQVVTSRLLGIDRNIVVKWTDYFNHSLAPDMVLNWPRESRERHVFLRPSAHLSWLAQDLKQIGAGHPILLSLAVPEPGSGSTDSTERLQDDASASETLITDPTALDAINTSKRDKPIVEILSQAVLQGGKGFIQRADAERASSVTAGGFEAAEGLDALGTKMATDLMETLLEPSQAGRMTRMLQAVWEGHGGSLTDFPGRPDFSGPLTDDDVVYLLDTIETEDADFWRSVGRTMTLAQLARLKIADPSTGLQRLVAANLDRLIAKAFCVRSDLAMEEAETPRWLIAQGCLAMRGGDWTAYVAPSKIDELPEPQTRDGVGVQALRKRTSERKLDVGNVQLRKGDLAITYETTGRANVVNDHDLTQLATSKAQVVRATVSLAGGRRLICDFTTATASGHTRALFGVAELMRTAIPIFMELSEDEAFKVGELLTVPDEQATLPLESGSITDAGVVEPDADPIALFDATDDADSSTVAPDTAASKRFRG